MYLWQHNEHIYDDDRISFLCPRYWQHSNTKISYGGAAWVAVVVQNCCRTADRACVCTALSTLCKCARGAILTGTSNSLTHTYSSSNVTPYFPEYMIFNRLFSLDAQQ